jgi:hypothetical protein
VAVSNGGFYGFSWEFMVVKLQIYEIHEISWPFEEFMGFHDVIVVI